MKHPWQPIYNHSSEVLILGTFPSPRSRSEGFYFGHPQNCFWQTLAASLGVSPLPPGASAAEKTEFLLHHHLALWDVVYSCEINGASDASIRTVVPNCFCGLINATQIRAIFTTGRTATRLFNTLVAGEAGMRSVYLPSTSPANRAQQARPEFAEQWAQVGRLLRGEPAIERGGPAVDALHGGPAIEHGELTVDALHGGLRWMRYRKVHVGSDGRWPL